MANDVVALDDTIHDQVRSIGPDGLTSNKPQDIDAHRPSELIVSAVDQLRRDTQVIDDVGITRAELLLVGTMDGRSCPPTGRRWLARTGHETAGASEHRSPVADLYEERPAVDPQLFFAFTDLGLASFPSMPIAAPDAQLPADATADVAYVTGAFRPLEHAARELVERGILPRATYVLPDGTPMVPADHAALLDDAGGDPEAVVARFRERFVAAGGDPPMPTKSTRHGFRAICIPDLFRLSFKRRDR